MHMNLLLWHYNLTKVGTLINYLFEKLYAHIRLKNYHDTYSWRNSKCHIKWEEMDGGEDRMSCYGLSLKFLTTTEPRIVKDPCGVSLQDNIENKLPKSLHVVSL